MNLLITLLATLLSLAGLLSARPQSSQGNSGLRMSVRLDSNHVADPKVPKFTVELQNTGEKDLILNLGFMLANGKNQYPNAIVLILTDSKGKIRRFELTGPAIIAGRLDPLIVPLPVGSTFSIPVDPEKYWVLESKEFEYKGKPGTYLIEAQLTGKGLSQQEANLDVKGLALLPYWMGTISSNRLQFEFAGK
jgi:hypothetical protein